MARILYDSLRLHRAILELRHPNAYLYWDSTGQCVNDIEKDFGGKLTFKEVGSNECTLRFTEIANAQASFGIKHMTMSANSLKNVKPFQDHAPIIFEAVKKNLGIEKITRAGFRLLYALEMDSEKKAEEYIASLDWAEVDAGRFAELGSKAVLLQPAIRVIEGDTSLRIALNAVKRSDAEEPGAKFDKYNPRCALLVDLDFFKENVDASKLDISSFVHHCDKKVKDHIADIINN